MLKKSIISFSSTILLCSYLLPGIADAKESNKENDDAEQSYLTSIILLQNQEFSSINDPISVQLANEWGITEDDMIKLDEELNEAMIDTYSIGIGSIIGIIAGAIGLGGSLYAAGKYAARQCEVRLGLTEKGYKKNRWLYRAGIGATFGPLVVAGFDDYFYGV
ncbi:hypothetical protein ACQKMI_23675 [Lysinibacillus sp. NPDC097214]|uniref:hypothetical protein n=1 Tax=Lysinibacillus sp. NPDC097214 TaxID=3390584 RepID=UPI003D072EF4